MTDEEQIKKGRGSYTHDEKRDILAQVKVLREQGMKARDACDSVGIKVKQYGNWTQRIKNMGAPKAVAIVPMTNDKEKRIRLLEIENQRLKMIVAELSLDKQQLIEYSGRHS